MSVEKQIQAAIVMIDIIIANQAKYWLLIALVIVELIFAALVWTDNRRK